MTHLLSSLIAGLLFLTLFLPNSVAGVMAAPPSNAHAATATHVVAAGDTLYSIATRYGTTVAALKAANGLTSDLIWVGQTLQVGTSSSTPSTVTPSTVTPSTVTPSTVTPSTVTPSTGTYHTVVQGDTLYSLARRYGTTVDAIMQANGLTSPNIYIGQRLIIPSSTVQPTSSVTPSTGTYHTVVQGDTLYSIARRYGTTVEAIMVANALPSTHIYVGQQLLIPSTQTPSAQTAGTTTVGTATPTVTPTGTRFATGSPPPTPTSTVPQMQTQTQTPTRTATPTVPTPTQTATPSPTTTPTQAEISYVERVVELSNLMANSMTFIGAQLIALSNNPALLNDPEWVVTTFATVETMRGHIDQIRALTIPPRYLAAGNELISAVNLLDQALDALTLGLTNKDLSQINLFTQLVTDALAALNRAKAALPT